MAFHADFMVRLTTHIATVLTIPAAQVIVGRRPQRTPREVEVWVEPRAGTTESDGIGRMVAHSYGLHVRERGLSDGTGAGTTQANTAKARAQALADSLDGQGVLQDGEPASLPSLVACNAQVDTTDTDPDEQNMTEAVVGLVAFEREV